MARTKQIEDRRMMQLAYKLARSGEFSIWYEIVWGLESLGYKRARRLIATDKRKQEKLNGLCALAKIEKQNTNA